MIIKNKTENHGLHGSSSAGGSAIALSTGLFFLALFTPALICFGQQPVPIPKPLNIQEQDQGRQKEIYRISRLARSAETAGKLERALDLWRAVIALRPDDYSARRGIQRTLIGLERYDEALEFLGSLAASTGSGGNLRDLISLTADRIEVLYMAGRPDDAENEIESALTDFKGQDRIYSEIASVLFGQRHDDEAFAVIKRGRSESGNPHLFAREMARWHEAHMNWEEAIREYILYLEERSSRLNYITGAIGDMPAESGADSIAVKLISERIEDTDPDFSIVLRRLLASLHFKAKRYGQALAQYKLLDRMGREPGRELLQFADQLMTENEYALAWEAYNELVAAQLSAGSTAHALLGKGQAAKAEGEIDSARSAFSSVLKPESPPDALFEAYRSLGLLEFDNGGSPGKVRELLKSALKIAVKARIPRDSRDEIAVIAALSWAKEGDLDRARRELEAIIKPKRRSSRAASAARSELIRIAFQQGDLEEMRNQINALLISDPSSEYANDAIALAALLTDLKDSPDAVRALGKADLADFMSDSETAIHILDSLAISGSPRLMEEALWRMYRIELNRRRFESALGLLNRIIDLGGAALRADLALFHAGQICEENTGNQQMAAEFYERLLVEYPDSPLIDRTRRRLKTLI